MALGLMLIVQTGAALALEAGDGFDLRAVAPRPCVTGTDEIVVCGRKTDDEAFRLHRLPSGNFEPRPLRAQIGVGGGALSLVGEQKTFGDGSVSQRAMIKFKIKF